MMMSLLLMKMLCHHRLWLPGCLGSAAWHQQGTWL
jgi:hypothetical protein